MLSTIFNIISNRIGFGNKTTSSHHTTQNKLTASSAWTQVYYSAVEEPNMQRTLNMMYAPPVLSIQNNDELPGADFAPTLHSESMPSPTTQVRNKNAKRLLTAVGEIVSHPDMEVRKFVASHTQTPVVGLRALAFDPDEQVRLALASNPNCPGDIAKLLVADTSSTVSFEAVNSIRRSWLRRSA